MNPEETLVLGIESSCDDTAVAVCAGGKIQANVVATQLRHAAHGGVVPELASRMHQSAVVPVAQEALRQAGCTAQALTAIAVTAGPGLVGSLHVGLGFAKGLALALGKPLYAINHLHGHVASLLLAEPAPAFPFLCLTVSGGHTQLQVVRGPFEYEVLGRTLDDAAGEAFDKIGKLMGLPYPAGPALDRLARTGNPAAVAPFAVPQAPGYDFSFSGLKTAFLYHLQKAQAADAGYLDRHRADLCAAIQRTIVTSLLGKLFAAAGALGLTRLGIAGGVSANSELRARFAEGCAARGLEGFIPPFEYCTDNAAMIALAGHLRQAAGHAPDGLAVQAFASGGA